MTESDTTLKLRNALRAALSDANRVPTFAHKAYRDGTLGVWGHIEAALREMGDGEALENFFATDEWPEDSEE